LIGNIAAETSDHMPIVRKALAQSLANWTKLVAAVIRDGQGDGSIAAGLDADQVARFVINSWEGAIIRMKIANSRQPLDDFFSVTFPLFTRPGHGDRDPAAPSSSRRKPSASRSAAR
jgi:TetR/AcrR family transcriptional repressor of nem operon